MSSVPEGAPLDIRMPFTRAQALAAGITDHQLHTHDYQTLLRGIYISTTIRVTPVVRARAALLSVNAPEANVSHATAARLYGIPIPAIGDEHVSVRTPAQRRSPKGLVCHVAPAEGTHWVNGMLVSTPERTFCELAALIGLVDLVVAGDHMVRRGLTTVERLRAAAEASPLRHKEAAVEAVGLVRDRVDSPAETRFRLLLVLAGLPEPVVNHEIRADNGLLLRRHDLALPDQRLAFEVQGRHHVDVVATWEKDIEREEDSKVDGWRITNIVASSLYTAPEQVLHRAWVAMRQSGVPDVPKRPREKWRSHFGR